MRTVLPALASLIAGYVGFVLFFQTADDPEGVDVSYAALAVTTLAFSMLGCAAAVIAQRWFTDESA